jgi:hypothetical protein
MVSVGATHFFLIFAASVAFFSQHFTVVIRRRDVLVEDSLEQKVPSTPQDDMV